MNKVQIIIIAGLIVVGVIIGVGIMTSKERSPKQDTLPLSILKEAEAAFEHKRLLEARALYKKVLESVNDPNMIDKIQEKIETINMQILFSNLKDTSSIIYVVKPKDTLSKIAKKFNTTVSLIKRSNNLSSDIIRPKQKLKIETGVFSLLIDKSQNLLFLKRNDTVIKTYIVATGKDNSTPTGIFTLDRNKLKNPTWFKTGAIIPPGSPDNILGSRWMGLEGVDSNGEPIKGYGIHGTTDPSGLGQQITLGCIRMRNKDVEELFDILPVGTKVIIID